MNSDIILPWVFTLLITLGTVLFFMIRIRRKEKKILSKLREYATENHCSLNYSDHWDKTLIGLDTMKTGKLLFIRKNPDGKQKMIIDLGEILGCKLEKNERTEKVGRETIHVTDRIQLVLIPKASDKDETILEFYNTDYNSLTLSGELQMAEKWQKLIEKMLKSEINRAVPSENKYKKSKSPARVPD